ncbi:MAG: hypothetical protein NVV82_05045 [Sporocytophaga sp.]|nr:hypothetical protein [Sporocytophaga sp.]
MACQKSSTRRKKAEKQDKPVDEVAQAKRQQSRHQKVSDGIDELKLWIKDLIRNGILSAPEKPLTYWENMAKRLIDAQSPGLSRMITNLGNTNFYTENWQGSFLDQLLKILLIIEGYHNLSALDPALQEDIKSSIGFTQNQEELKEQKGITDTWFVLGKQVVEEDTYTTEKYWMLGQQSNKYALILQFVFNGQGRSISLIPGSSIEAELVYYPSVAPLRAIIKSSTGSNQTVSLNSHNTWKDVLDEEVRIYSLLPFSGERPLVISNVTPVLSDNQWWLMDTAKDINLISPEFKSIYKLLAISGGNPVTIAAVGYHNTYEPIACWHKEQFYIL